MHIAQKINVNNNCYTPNYLYKFTHELDIAALLKTNVELSKKINGKNYGNSPPLFQGFCSFNVAMWLRQPTCCNKK